VKFNSLADQLFRFFYGGASHTESRQVGRESFQPCLLQDAVERSAAHLLRGVTPYSHATQFHRMLELTMTFLLRDLIPAVALNQFQQIPDFPT
jgi:hypothetical protein